MSTLYGSEARRYLDNAWMARHYMPTLHDQEQVHINDPHCGDTRGRLYVIKKPDAMLFHCHNCGTSGHFTVKDYWARIEEKKEAAVVPNVVTLNITEKPCKYEDLPIDAQLWLAQYEMQDLSPIAYSGNRLWLPIRQGVYLTGEQGRAFHNTTAKYITRFLEKPPGAAATKGRKIGVDFNGKSTIFFVEDLLSAYKINKAGGGYVCMLGTSLNVEAWNVTTDIKTAIVWTDPDTAGHMAQVELFRQLAPLFKSVDTFVDSRQPKEVPLDELKDIVNARS